MADIICYWAKDCNLWICYCVDCDGNQIWETQYYPNKETLKLDWLI